jgi:hypothetical protein
MNHTMGFVFLLGLLVAFVPLLLCSLFARKSRAAEKANDATKKQFFIKAQLVSIGIFILYLTALCEVIVSIPDAHGSPFASPTERCLMAVGSLLLIFAGWLGYRANAKRHAEPNLNCRQDNHG